MADVLIRGVADLTPVRLDQQVKQQGVSRNTLLKAPGGGFHRGRSCDGYTRNTAGI